ncbi:Serine protease [Rhodovastum atsumiense]|uniref:Serine protease n=1 Tax=Rhodovastum atsumiense TaxID=504468 RepID=A0A5M6ILL5_9PROT|nr:S1C family serine protease [Rhodovastum atsumiense]KAA5608448.1 serine protease [Rhodovastum atsumiense]CAH2604649.1 Serine protease [Rhodovastum atsumiense]
MDEPDWDIPTNLQPDPDEYGFDLERTLRAVVGLRANVPPDAFTASTLGTERTGSGIVIREDGLVLTIGYLITEAETVWLITGDGRAVPGHALGFDQATGFGLVQALGRLNLPAVEFGNSDAATLGTTGIIAACGGRERAVETKVVGKQEFAGYWEYLLEEALFTAPAHPFWSGAALLGRDGKLLGIGSLILQQGDGKRRMDLNMIVPIGLLPPILDDILTLGRPKAPPRPWLGLYAMESDGGIVIGGTATKGPAERAGLLQGDRIIGVGEESITDLASLWRKVWSTGTAGAPVVLRVNRDGSTQTVCVMSADRMSFLRGPRLH